MVWESPDPDSDRAIDDNKVTEGAQSMEEEEEDQFNENDEVEGDEEELEEDSEGLLFQV